LAAPRPVRRVTGTVERAIHAQGPCQGGVRVTDEEMQEWAAKTQRSPIAKSTFTVFAGTRRVGKVVTRFKTDRAGRFEVRLPEGEFCVMAGEIKEAAPENSLMRMKCKHSLQRYKYHRSQRQSFQPLDQHVDLQRPRWPSRGRASARMLSKC
jgi:hypothetical protein